MRCIVLRLADPDTEAGVLPSPELFAVMGQYMEALANAGVLLGGEGLHPSVAGARVEFSGGKPSVVNGPFGETRALVAGYVILQVKSLDEALDWCKRWPAQDAGGNVRLEIRRIYEAEDFGTSFTPEEREREERLRAELAARQQ
ncbi:YciI family protein [Ralstonia solanacearum]|uniref:YciI family protein n=1 Tax=Ralstonia solanacearum TaxID=305 RepID=UPI0005C4820F|nr:YciI family protein [Ralstonia solanacearum]MBB6592883.1 YciI family protein [Ralstonia solanacearum]MBB6597110.1 YciI family protein [Ralstonia solanacearum]MDB0544385.1 YciI family protein [Ralstonia solanacearum]MDB0553949.1 YciI family protein [Ralstonia solanacearum]MDB0559303.1 YciI family protein [Ralstonia solanacearum]